MISEEERKEIKRDVSRAASSKNLSIQQFGDNQVHFQMGLFKLTSNTSPDVSASTNITLDIVSLPNICF